MTHTEIISLLKAHQHSFVTLYHRSSTGALWKYNIVLGINYRKAKLQDLIQVQALTPSTPLEAQAYGELIASLSTPWQPNPDHEPISPGVRKNVQTGDHYIFGWVRKAILVEGEYVSTRSKSPRPRTLVKDQVRKTLRTPNFRLWNLSQIERITFGGATYDLPKLMVFS